MLRGQYIERCQRAATLQGRSRQTLKFVLRMLFTCCTVVYGAIYVYRRAALEKQDLHLCNFVARQSIAEIAPGPMRRLGHIKWKIERTLQSGTGETECRSKGSTDDGTGSWIDGSKGAFDYFASSFVGVLAVHRHILRAYSQGLS